jgi:hypothetical protein
MELMTNSVNNNMKTTTTNESRKDRPKGDFIFSILNHCGITKDVRVDSEIFEAHSPVSRILYIHAQNDAETDGLPFEILTRRWEEKDEIDILAPKNTDEMLSLFDRIAANLREGETN